jgi:shikimate dehydrogenase
MQQAAFKALGIAASYEAIETSIDQAASVVAQLRTAHFAGWNVTTPLKEIMVELVDHLTGQAAAARAVNTVRTEADGALCGHTTDGAGLLAALKELWSWEPGGSRALVLGSGPAARAIALALRDAGAAEISCWSRNAHAAAAIGPPPAGIADLVVSTLPPEATIPDAVVQCADDRTLVFDANYGRSATPVQHMAARARSDGLPLLLHQGALSLEWWTGRPAPLAAMRQALEGRAAL